MFDFKEAFIPDCLFDCPENLRLVGGRDIFLKPIRGGALRVGNETFSIKLAHFFPVGAHPINDVGCGIEQRA